MRKNKTLNGNFFIYTGYNTIQRYTLFFTVQSEFERNEKEMLVCSNLSPITYRTNEVIRVVNDKQFKLYIKNGAYPVDIYASIDEKSGKDIVVYVFKRTDTVELYKQWLNYELE